MDVLPARWLARVGIGLLMAAGTAFAVSPATAAAAPANVAPAPGCTTSGVPEGLVACVRLGLSAPASVRTTAATAAIPEGCGNGTWANMSRFVMCKSSGGLYQVIVAQGGEVVGEIAFNYSSMVTMQARDLRWTQSFEYAPVRAWGVLGSPTLWSAPDCMFYCSIVGGNPPTGWALSNHSGTATFTSPRLPGQYWGSRSDWGFWFVNPATVNQVSNTLWTNYPGHRCDDVLPGGTAGCVNQDFIPTLEVPESRYPLYAFHIRNAINTTNLPSQLTRTTNSATIDANRNISCPTGTNYPRPTGYTCDEYPFASTTQGAAANPAGFTFNFNTKRLGKLVCQVSWLTEHRSTTNRGYSTCMIPSAQNSLGGSDLQSFFLDNRVIDRDNFNVRA
ncbi:NucA/NucB deoxyribonuclease domain-containing protein [Micromonospora sp. CPCC 206061]|uniref:NucA/NucB deoxyribonuclease domain-containing protein n=1 Tax=Micromonospora sp. CPCC 206061 TaxID=3122410 RepID=UPI002FEEAD70